jgi:hypothetical protein
MLATFPQFSGVCVGACGPSAGNIAERRTSVESEPTNDQNQTFEH